jgi:hypothetical protein
MFELAADDHCVGLYATGQVRARLDGQVALDVDVALEVTGDTDMSRAFDLALNGEPGSNDGLLVRCVRAMRRRGWARGRLTDGSKDGYFLGCLRGGLRPTLVSAKLIFPQRHDEPPISETCVDLA